MRSTIIDAGSKQSDVWGVLTGLWDEYDSHGWHILRTPFFLVLTATLEKGAKPLPFRFRSPVVGTLTYGDGTVSGIVVRPGESAVNVEDTCIARFQLFGNEAEVTGVI